MNGEEVNIVKEAAVKVRIYLFTYLRVIKLLHSRTFMPLMDDIVFYLRPVIFSPSKRGLCMSFYEK